MTATIIQALIFLAVCWLTVRLAMDNDCEAAPEPPEAEHDFDAMTGNRFRENVA